jgi:hypothetical protein
MGSFRDLPADLPVPEDDGAADHLRGRLGDRPVTDDRLAAHKRRELTRRGA